MENDKLKMLASQLRKPSGENGIQVGEMMNETNIEMTKHAIEQLVLKNDDHLLEIGHGNGRHLSNIFKIANGLKYVGFDISSLMNSEAKKINEKWVKQGVAEFHVYDGEILPSNNHSFSKVMTVNTVYFWSHPERFLNEIYRVLDHDGLFVNTFAKKEFMEKLPFTSYGFELYDQKSYLDVVNKTAFQLVSIVEETEHIKSKTGDLVEREFVSVTVQKKL